MVANQRYRKKFGKTGKGKDIYIVNVPGTNLFEVEFYPGGEIPKILRGKWSDIPALASKIQTYINNCYLKAGRMNAKGHLAQHIKFQKTQADAAKTLVAQVECPE